MACHAATAAWGVIRDTARHAAGTVEGGARASPRPLSWRAGEGRGMAPAIKRSPLVPGGGARIWLTCPGDIAPAARAGFRARIAARTFTLNTRRPDPKRRRRDGGRVRGRGIGASILHDISHPRAPTPRRGASPHGCHRGAQRGFRRARHPGRHHWPADRARLPHQAACCPGGGDPLAWRVASALQPGCVAQMRHRGIGRVAAVFSLAVTAHNLIRLPKRLGQPARSAAPATDSTHARRHQPQATPVSADARTPISAKAGVFQQPARDRLVLGAYRHAMSPISSTSPPRRAAPEPLAQRGRRLLREAAHGGVARAAQDGQ